MLTSELGHQEIRLLSGNKKTFSLDRPQSTIKIYDVRGLCDKIKARNAPATALHVRDVIRAVFEFAALKGLKIPNLAASVAPKAITTIKARDRALSPLEVRLMLLTLEQVRLRWTAVALSVAERK